ncbi:MAG: hypothetical protein J6J36_06050 [Clostridia bacterium]|nr:hypothetical protein [Clostridia bacterium]
MISMEVYNKCLEFRKKTGRWPRVKIVEDGRIVYKKDIKSNKKYKHLLEEIDLAYEWKRSPERKLLMEYKGVKIEDIPEEYQDMIRNLRSFGLGVDCKTVDIVEEFVKFYNIYGRAPRRGKDGKPSTKEEQIEKRLYSYWCTCKENKLLEEYVSMELEDIPEEHRAMVEKLRSIGLGLKSKKTTNLIDYISFVQDKRREPVYIMHPKSNEEIYERDLKQRWRMCKENNIYKKYEGVLVEEIPEEDRALVEKIRNLWQEVDGTNIAEDMINFIKKYKREPRNINLSLKCFERKLTEEEQNENLLRARWDRSFEKQVLDRFVGIQEDEIPEEYKKIVGKFREIGLGFPESLNTRMYINFILENKRIPRQVIYRNGTKVKVENCTTEEIDEQAIRRRWDISKDRDIYERYRICDLDDKTIALYSNMIKVLEEAYLVAEAERARITEEKQKKADGKRKKSKNIEGQPQKKKKLKNREKVSEDERKRTEEERRKIAEERRKAKDERKIIAEERRKAKDERKKFAEEKEKIRAENRRKAEEEDRAKAEEKKIIEDLERAKQQAERKLKEERKRKKEEPKRRAIEQKILEKLEIAKRYSTFIKTFNRVPRAKIKIDGKDVETDDLLPNELAEIELTREWRKCKFLETIEEYAGIPIEELPEIYKDIIKDFRALGFGLTYEEYAKYRESNITAPVLRSLKMIRDKALKKKSKALALEKEVAEQLSLRGKEQDDE